MKRPLFSPAGRFDLADPGEPSEHEPIPRPEAARIVRELAADPINRAILRRVDSIDRVLREISSGRMLLYRAASAEFQEPPEPAPDEKSAGQARAREKKPRVLCIRLDIDPNEASSRDDRFVLRSSDGSYCSEKTVKDDQTPGDQYVDLRFTGLDEDLSYTLEVFPKPSEPPYAVFWDRPYPELAGLSGVR